MTMQNVLKLSWCLHLDLHLCNLALCLRLTRLPDALLILRFKDKCAHLFGFFKKKILLYV